MAGAAAAVALDQQEVIRAFMRTDAVRPSEAIFFEPKGYFQRSAFKGYIKTGVIKPNGARWFLDVPAYTAAKRKQWYKVLTVTGLLTAAAAAAALL